MSDFRDGTSNTIVASEVRSGQDDEFTDFTAAGGVDYRGMWGSTAGYLHIDTPNSSVPDADCMLVYMCGDPAMQPAPCAGTCGSDAMRMTARSYHPGGVNVVYADGHVDFYSDTVSLAIWEALATIAGSEASSGEY